MDTLSLSYPYPNPRRLSRPSLIANPHAVVGWVCTRAGEVSRNGGGGGHIPIADAVCRGHVPAK